MSSSWRSKEAAPMAPKYVRPLKLFSSSSAAGSQRTTDSSQSGFQAGKDVSRTSDRREYHQQSHNSRNDPESSYDNEYKK